MRRSLESFEAASVEIPLLDKASIADIARQIFRVWLIEINGELRIVMKWKVFRKGVGGLMLFGQQKNENPPRKSKGEVREILPHEIGRIKNSKAYAN